MGDITARYFAGDVYGLPMAGRGSPATYDRRVFGVVVDMALLWLASLADGWGMTLLGVFVANEIVLVALTGASVGKLVARTRVFAVDEGEVLTTQPGLTFLTAFSRALTLGFGPFAVIIWLVSLDRDRRSLIDRWTRTIVLEH